MSPLRTHRECLGDILLRAHLVDEEAMQRALERQKLQPGRFGTQLLSFGAVSEDDLAKALGIQHRVPPFLPSRMTVEPEAIARVPLELARRLGALPVRWDAVRGTLEIALADPGNLAAGDEIRFSAGARKLTVLAAPETTIERLLALHYEGISQEATYAPEIPLASRRTPVSSTRPRAAAGGGRPRALVADPDPKRRRALAALLEGAGHTVERAGTAAEARRALAERGSGAGWAAVWVHRDWESEVAHPAAQVFDDPVAALCQVADAARLAREAQSLAEEAARTALRDSLPRVRQVIGLVRFLAGRKGFSGPILDCLELATWRGALAGWVPPRRDHPLPGEEILRAVMAYERALTAGTDSAGAAESVRGDVSLDPDAVAGLLRWAEGAHLLAGVGTRRLLALFPKNGVPETLLASLEKIGWTVERAEDVPDFPVYDAVLAAVAPGLALLESLSAAPAGDHPPVFLVSPSGSGPDATYALRLNAEDVFPADAHPEVVAAKLDRAASRTKPPEGIVSGNLRDMGFADIVQILANGLKTAVIRLEAPGREGEVALQGGAIVDARSGKLTGEEAFYAIMGWEDGAFRIEPGARARGTTIQGNPEGLLMEGFRRMDEARKAPSEDLPELG